METAAANAAVTCGNIAYTALDVKRDRSHPSRRLCGPPQDDDIVDVRPKRTSSCGAAQRRLEGWVSNEMLHDAALTSIEIDTPTRSAVLRFRMEDGERIKIELGEIKCIRATDVLIQNVVSRLLVTPSTELPRDEIERLVVWACSDESGQVLATHDFIKNVCAAIQKGELRLLWLDRSVGAEAVVVSKLLSVDPPP